MNRRGLLILLSQLFLLISFSSFSQSAGKLFSQGKDAAKDGLLEQAINLFNQAIALKSDNDEYFEERGLVYEALGQLDKAVEDYDKALALDSDKKLYLHNADMKILLQRWPQALFDAERVIEDDKSEIKAYEQKAWCLINMKKFSDALATTEAALAKNQYNHRLHYLKGMSKDSLKDYATAVTEYQRAVTIMRGLTEKDKPWFKPYYTDLAMAQVKMEMNDDAIKNYTTAVNIDSKDSILPKNYRVYYFRSFAYLAKNDFTNALGDLTKSVVMEPKDPEPIYQRAMVNMKTSQYQSAINDLTECLRIDDKNAEAYSNRGKCQLASNNLKEAISDFGKAVALANKPDDVKALADAKQKLYEMNRESDSPDIKLEYPVADMAGFINVFDNQVDVVIEGYIKDKSQIEFIKMNGVKVNYRTEELNPEFKWHVPLKGDVRKIVIEVSDVYHNEASKTIKVGRIINDSKVKVTFAGKILADDGTKAPLANRDIYLVNEKGEVFFQSKTDPNGRFKFENLPYDQGYFLTMDVTDTPLAKAPKFMITDENGTPVLASVEDGKQKFKFSILPSDYNTMTLMTLDDAPLLVDIKGKLIGADAAKTPLTDITVTLINSKGEAVASKKTDGFGAFLFSKMQPRDTYTIRTDSAESKKINENKILITDENGKIIKELMRNPEGYFAYTLLPADRVFLTKISAVDPWLKALKLSKDKPEMAIIENIYYQSGAFEILPEAKPVIQKAIDALAGNPRLVIEVQSHTDAVASDEYNLDLSQKRANAVVEYMASKGIDKKRITAKGFGETQLINKCTNGTECSDAEHKQNRRTVFRISYVGN